MTILGGTFQINPFSPKIISLIYYMNSFEHCETGDFFKNLNIE